MVSLITLDPVDWESMRKLGHKMLDDMMDYIKTVRERPVWQHVPDHVKACFRKPLPRHPQPPEEIYKEFVEKVLPYPMGNIHPRFWGWILGTGTVMGAFAELLAASMNTNTGGGDNHIAKISLVGVGMRSHAGIASKMFETLAKEGINIRMISTSEIKVSVVVDEKYLELGVRALHDTFELDQEPAGKSGN